MSEKMQEKIGSHLPISIDAQKAMHECWRRSNLPFTAWVLIEREYLNDLINEIWDLSRRLAIASYNKQPADGER